MLSVLDTRRPRLLLALFCLVLWLPGFLTLPPGDRDESRFAQATKQMLETGDFVRIMNGEEPRNRKPIGIHWLQAPFAAAARATGIAEANPVWPYRIPSALGGLVAVLATFSIGRALVGQRAALLGAGMLAASAILVVETHIAKTDAALLGATTLAMSVLARAALDPASVRTRHAALFWLAMGAGILVKGPITPMVVALAALTLSLWERRARWLLALRSRWGVPLMLAVVLPWFVAIDAATGGRFLADSVGGDLGRKLVQGDESHWGPPGLHLLLLPVLLFPSTLLLPGALRAAWLGRAAQPTRILLAWIVPAWLVFEAAPTKLPHYPLPLYPPLCLLMAAWVLDRTRAKLPRWLAGLSAALVVIAACVLGGGAAALPFVVGEGYLLGWPALLAAGLVAWLVLRVRAPMPGARAALAGLAAAPLLYWAVLGLELPHLQALWIAPRVVEAMAALPSAQTRAPLGAVGFHEPSLMVLAGTDTRWLAPGWDGARALRSGEVGLLLVGDRDMAAFREEAARLGLHPRALAEIDGFNYSRGRRVALTLLDAP